MSFCCALFCDNPSGLSLPPLRQGKRIGKEITFYSVWFELRWGITACRDPDRGLITVIFYNHPSTTSATLFFRTVPILPESSGRVAEIYVESGALSPKEQPIFRLDSSKQEAAVETARRKITENEARSRWRQPNLKAEAQIREAEGSLSRPWTNWKPKRSCTGETRATSRFARSKG